MEALLEGSMSGGVKWTVPQSTLSLAFDIFAMLVNFTAGFMVLSSIIVRILTALLKFVLSVLSSQKLQEQDELAEQLKGRLRWEQRELRFRLEQLQRGSERMRNDSQGSTMSSERSDSDRGRSLCCQKDLMSRTLTWTVITKRCCIA